MPNSEVAWRHILENSKILFLTLKSREKYLGTLSILKKYMGYLTSNYNDIYTA